MGIEFKTGAVVEAFRRMADEFASRVRAEVGLSLRRARVHAEGTSLFQDKTGKLRASIRQRTTGRFEGQLYTLPRAKHATFIENGTRRHTILPKRGTHLKFKAGGRTVFARKVEHPGTKPRPFMNAAARVEDTLLRNALQSLVSFLVR